MDLHAAERLNGKCWNAAKFGALFCFGLAGGILVASLLLPASPQAVPETGLAASLSTPAR